MKTLTRAKPAGWTTLLPGSPGRRALAGVALLVVGGLVGLLTLPRTDHLAAATTGDEALAAEVRTALGDAKGYHGLSVTRVRGGVLTSAGLGYSDGAGTPVDVDTRFEIGSFTKAMTGMLLADLEADGVLSRQDTLGELLPAEDIDDPDLAEVTAQQLAEHRSGLPRLAHESNIDLAGTFLAQLRGNDPYRGTSTEDVREVALDQDVESAPSGFDYSNLGVALLGDALAQSSGSTYAQLLSERLLTPLGMQQTVVVADESALPGKRAEARTAGNRQVEEWIGVGYAPAGIGVWSTSADLGLLAAAVLDGSAPGMAALEPSADTDSPDRKVGLNWFVETREDRTITWHNGATSGFRAFVGVDRANDTAIVLLGNSTAAVDALGFELLRAGGDEGGGPGVGLGITSFLCLAAVGTPLLTLHYSRPRLSRLAIASSLASGVAMLVAAHRIGFWDLTPYAVWIAGAAAFTVTGGLLLSRWAASPVRAGRRAGTQEASTALSLGYSVAVLLLLLA